MIRLLKRLAILAGLWLGVSVAGVVYLNTRSQEQVEADLRAVLEPTLGGLEEAFESAVRINSSYVAEPLPADDVMRADTETTLAEVEALYDELIGTHQALQDAHTDHWEKRWAGDAVTIAQMAREHAVETIERAQRDVENPSGPFRRSASMTAEAISHRLDKARSAAALQKMFIEEDLATARESLQAVRGGSQ